MSLKHTIEVSRLVLKNMVSDPEFISSLIYGSMVEGFSNKYSDLDICIVTKNTKETSFVTVRDIRVDIEKLPLDQLKDMIIKAHDPHINPLALVWCHRIKTGIPVYDERGILEELRKKINLRTIIRNLVEFYSSRSMMLLNDSSGAFESEDYETAFISARFAVEEAVMAYLSSHGIINPKKKWIYRYLLKVQEKRDKVVEHFINVERACPRGPEEINGYIYQASNFANRLIAQAQTCLKQP